MKTPTPVLLLLLMLVVGCFSTVPRLSLPPVPSDKPVYNRASSATQPLGGYWLTWTNAWSFTVNVVDHKINLNDQWQLYTYVTNNMTNVPWLRIYPTNAQEFYRVGYVRIW